MGKRDRYQLVPEDDADFARFWANYPHRVAKKEARKTWLKLNPSSALVDRMVRALEWQTKEWERKAGWYTPPYPASWLNAERWNDEAPVRNVSKEPARWICPHVEHCSSRGHCESALIIGKKALKASAVSA